MTHRSNPPENVDCLCCYETISNENFVEYLPYPCDEEPVPQWQVSAYCQSCVEYLIGLQFKNYLDAWKKTTCKAEQRRLITRGPPINLRDDKALPCPGNTEVHLLWYMSDSQERVAKLKDSLLGEERQIYWDEMKNFFAEDEPEDETALKKQEVIRPSVISNTMNQDNIDAATTVLTKRKLEEGMNEWNVMLRT